MKMCLGNPGLVMDKYIYLLFCRNKRGWVPYHKKLIGIYDTEDEAKDKVIHIEDNYNIANGSCLVIERWTINKKEDVLIKSFLYND